MHGCSALGRKHPAGRPAATWDAVRFGKRREGNGGRCLSLQSPRGKPTRGIMSQFVAALRSDVRFLLYPLRASPLHDLAAELARRGQCGLTLFDVHDWMG